MPANGIEIVALYQRWHDARRNFDFRWEQMASILAPSRQGIIVDYSPGVKLTQNVFDSTSIAAAEQFAMFLGGRIINPADRWLSYEMEQADIQKIDAVREWNEECRDRTLKRLGNSTFYGEAPESLVDWVGFGTNFLLLDELPQGVSETKRGFRGFYVRAEKIGRFVIQEGASGMVDAAMRKMKVSARVCEDRFGNAIPQTMKDKIKTGKGDDLFEVIHAILPRKSSERKFGALGMPWLSAWVDMKSKTVMSEGGYRRFPVAVSRYQQTPGEVYGRGRGDIAFPDVWTLNQAKSMELDDLAMKIRPPVLVRHDTVIGTLRLVPGGPTVVNTHGRPIQDVIMPFQSGSNPQVVNLKEEELRQSIREIFFVDTIRQLLQVSKSEMTAFEFQQKLSLLFSMISTVYGRLRREFLQTIIDIAWDLQFAEGDFPPPPREVWRSNGAIKAVFENPLDRAQRAGDVEALQHAIADLTPMAQILGPSVFDRLNPDKASDGVYMDRGVPADWLRNDDELAAKRTADVQAAQQQKQLAAVGQGAEALGKAAPFVEAIKPEPKTGVMP